jgi:predicted transposase YdaD
VQQSGQEATFLIHVEAQASSQKHFDRRMFHYFARLHQRHLKDIYPIVVFSFDQPYRAEADRYVVQFPNRKILEFNFESIQLNRLNWRDYLNQANPVAAALMAKMQIAEPDRPTVKAECLRLLATLRLDPARTRLISGFVDTYLRLNPQEEQVFQGELGKLEAVEQERVMQIVTSWMEQGLEQGLEQGRQETKTAIALNLLRQGISMDTIAQATGLTIAQLQQLQSDSQ